MSLRAWSAFVLSMAPAVVLLLYMRARFEHRMPALGNLAVKAILVGALAGLFAHTGFTIMEQVFGQTEIGRLHLIPDDFLGVYVFGVVAPVEEVFKCLAAFAVGVVRTRPGGLGDRGTVLATGVVGLGFALYENYQYAVLHGAPTIPGLVTLPIAHLLFGCLLGVGIAHASYFTGLKRVGVVFIALIVVVLIHGAFDRVVLPPPMLSGALGPMILLVAVGLTFWGVRTLDQRKVSGKP
jgi:RsiW-degrading membrane proteinase PrsW (M82 family)